MSKIINNSPEKAGALRGSDKILDKFKLVGKERKEALSLVAKLASEISMAQSIYINSYPIHLAKEKNDREKLQQAVPLLSQDAKSYLNNIEKNIPNDLNVTERINQELAQFKTAMDKRFGKDAIFENNFKFDVNQVVKKEHVQELQQAIKFLKIQKEEKIQSIMRSRAVQKGKTI